MGWKLPIVSPCFGGYDSGMTKTQSLTAAQTTALANLKAAGTIERDQVSCQAAKVNMKALASLIAKGYVTCGTRPAVTKLRNGDPFAYTAKTVTAK
jgi:hypothetical protein